METAIAVRREFVETSIGHGSGRHFCRMDVPAWVLLENSTVVIFSPPDFGPDFRRVASASGW